MKNNASRMLDSFFAVRKDMGKDNGHSSVLVLKRSSTISEDSPQGVWNNMAERMMLEFAECGCPSKRRGKLSIHFAATRKRFRHVFARNFHDGTGTSVVGRQSSSSFVLSVVKTEVLLDWMSLLAKIFHCSNREEELKSFQ